MARCRRRARRHQGSDPRVERLRTIALLARLPQCDLEVIAHHADWTTRPAGTVLSRQGHFGPQCFLLAAGYLAVVRDGRPVGLLEPGTIAGEQGPLTSLRCAERLVALTRVELAVLDARSLQIVLHASPALDREVRRLVADRAPHAAPTR